MKQNNRILLEELVQEFLNEKKSFQNKINKNLNRIAEIDTYLNSIYEKEDADFKVFSPRNVENVYKEQIEKGKKEKFSMETENQYQYRQVNRIDRHLANLQAVLEDEEICVDTPENVVNNYVINDSDKNLAVLDIQEKDRQRIARDLHDTSLQNLAHLMHQIELSSMYIEKDPVRAKLEILSVNKELKRIIEDIRNIVFDLRPMAFDDLGFQETLSEFIQKLQTRYKVTILSEIDPVIVENRIELITLYRVIKECCLNSLEHSECSKLLLHIKSENNGQGIFIKIQDNGIGFDTESVFVTKQNHFGLKIVKERIELLGGTIQIHSIPGEGTDIEIHVSVIN